MLETKRGRPKGSSPTKAADDAVLFEAALRIYYDGVKTPTEVFQHIADQREEVGTLPPGGGDAFKRRLQRKWQREGANLLNRLERGPPPYWEQRLEFDAKVLELGYPELFALIERFGSSPEGQKVLASLGLSNRITDILSLGMGTVGDLIRQLSPVGAAAADEAFPSTYSTWSRFGIEPDSSFLIRMAELCLAKAAELDGTAASSKDASDRKPTP